jgi:two-component system phosphate regulon response regulator PhoB
MLHKPRILVVEDESGIADTIQYVLATDGFTPVWCGTAGQALREFALELPALAILDVGLPDLNGFELFKRLQALPGGAQVPMLFLTARSDEIDRVVGLELGADDYIAKPFSPRELVARVGAVLRRVRPALAGEQLGYADLEMDVTSHRVRRGGQQVPLGPTEFRLLKHFLEHPGRVFSRERLLDAVWSHDPDIDARTVDVHVRRLRQALNTEGQPDLIRTVRSAGYSLDAER